MQVLNQKIWVGQAFLMDEADTSDFPSPSLKNMPYRLLWRWSESTVYVYVYPFFLLVGGLGWTTSGGAQGLFLTMLGATHGGT